MDSFRYIVVGMDSEPKELPDLKRTTENELIELALQILAESASPERGMPTAELARKLRQRIVPRSDDLEILQDRRDDRLSQTIRNLVSHRTLQRQGLAKYYKHPLTAQGFYRLTEIGLETLRRTTQNYS